MFGSWMTPSRYAIIYFAIICYRNEGLFVGPSAALNVVGAVKAALRLKKQQEKLGKKQSGQPVVVTILCDGGDRYDIILVFVYIFDLGLTCVS
jgi:cysteine synthase